MKERMIAIDGSQGEGGGQILRTALTLSAITGKPFRMENIRAGRAKPGLLRQHLTCVQAAKEICSAEVSGDSLGSRSLEFSPGKIQSGSYRFSIGSAGSTSLVLQTIAIALATATAKSQVVVEGGTHNTMAPVFEFLQQTYLPALARMGLTLDLALDRFGFYPAGGGCVRLNVEPGLLCAPKDDWESFDPKSIEAYALVSNLSESIGEIENKAFQKALVMGEASSFVQSVPSLGPGNAFVVRLISNDEIRIVSVIGEKGLRSEDVALKAAAKVRTFCEANVGACEYLQDQLLLPLALAGSGSFTTVEPSSHTRTNIETIQRFLDVRFQVRNIERGRWKITIES